MKSKKCNSGASIDANKDILTNLVILLLQEVKVNVKIGFIAAELIEPSSSKTLKFSFSCV